MPHQFLSFSRVALVRLATLIAFTSCGPSASKFKERVFSCDTNRPASQCGTNDDGAAMTCFASTQLGAARGFCVEQCLEESDFSDDATTICMSNKAKLRVCHPSDPTSCGPDLSCYRTDLLRDQGVCVSVGLCETDQDCQDAVLNTCATTKLKEVSPSAPYLLDHLQCVATGCTALQSACPPGQACLQKLAKQVFSIVADICVPKCDSSGNCPPNYTCRPTVTESGTVDICVPGLQGSRCASSVDCMVGDCLPTDAGFKVCTIPCQTQEDCLPFGNTSGRQYCVSVDDRPQKYCVSTAPFQGADCIIDSQCPSPQTCYHSSAYHPAPTPAGECRLACGPGDECPVRGGIPHTCFVRGNDRSCYPGRVGLPCQRSEQCLPGMTCEDLPPEERLASSEGGGPAGHYCTLPCQLDTDCDAFLGTSQEAYCEAGWCRLGGGPDEVCLRDAHCRGLGKCLPNPSGTTSACVYNMSMP